MHSCHNFNFAKILHMFPAMKVHHQEFASRIQALWCNVMTKYAWCYGEISMCVVYRVEYIH